VINVIIGNKDIKTCEMNKMDEKLLPCFGEESKKDLQVLQKKIEDANLYIAKLTEDYLLECLSAKRGEIKTREDLKKFFFQCSCCKNAKPATEAVLLTTDLKMKNLTTEKTHCVEVSQKMALVCEGCSKKIRVRGKQNG